MRTINVVRRSRSRIRRWQGSGKLVTDHKRPHRSDSHVTSSVRVKRSRVHGRGVFAARAFRKGERIIEYTGRRVPWASVPDELDDPRMYYFGVGDGSTVIDPSIGGNEAQWINHSCDPNCVAREIRKRIFIHALRNIRAGEELSYDYRLETDNDVPRTKEIEDEVRCRCGSKKCRGTLLATS